MSTPEPQFTSEISVDVIAQCGSDELLAHAAWVSRSSSLDSSSPERVSGVLGYLLKHRHGTPFEHGFLCVRVHAPIFVWREWHRHRIGFSYNEESARYKTLDPVFYIPERDRPMFCVPGWKPGRPKFQCSPADTVPSPFLPLPFPDTAAHPFPDTAGDLQYKQLISNLRSSYTLAYSTYLENLSFDIDPGLARDCLPVGIYSSCYVSCNPRSIMSFLSLRTHHPEATHVSYPLYEIEVAASKLEKIFATHWPVTYAHYINNGRVAP